ncbi:probable membrane-associated kinase regulator 3 [Camellia sinensis]|nr:probable membrane-associated kinase regulator 3 [Camellia sinensis]
MEMEVMVQPPAADFNFDSAGTSPYVSSPSSPQRFGNFFFSAPTSPTGSSAFFRQFNSVSTGSTIPFNWEEKPGISKTNDNNDFEFNFSGQLEKTSVSADELFDGGKIKPLKPPPRLQFTDKGLADSPKSPRSPISARMFREALSPRHRRKDFDPFAEAIEQTRKESNREERGRERASNSSASSLRQKGTRSLSPFRVCDIFFESESDQQSYSNPSSAPTKTKKSSSSSCSNSFSFSSASSFSRYKKWKLRDLLLFRSASEGRATTSKDALKKYSLLKKSGGGGCGGEDVKNASFRSTESGGSVSSRRRGTAVSAHEMHYTANRAVAEEMRRKTFLPYKQGLLGCLGFNPGVPDFSKGLGSLTRG